MNDRGDLSGELSPVVRVWWWTSAGPRCKVVYRHEEMPFREWLMALGFESWATQVRLPVTEG